MFVYGYPTDPNFNRRPKSFFRRKNPEVTRRFGFTFTCILIGHAFEIESKNIKNGVLNVLIHMLVGV